MSDVLFTLLRYGLAVGFGVVLGRIFSSGKVKLRGRSVTIPYVDRNSINFTLIVVLLLAGSGLAILNTSVATNRQAQCNEEFNQTLKFRSAISQENEQLATQDRKALGDLFIDLLSIPRDVSREESAERSRRLIEDYNNEIKQTDARRAQNDQERKDNPLPEPKCGA